MTSAFESVVSRMFEKIDSDRSGSITRAEMDAVFRVFDADGQCSFNRSAADSSSDSLDRQGLTVQRRRLTLAFLDRRSPSPKNLLIRSFSDVLITFPAFSLDSI